MNNQVMDIGPGLIESEDTVYGGIAYVPPHKPVGSDEKTPYRVESTLPVTLQSMSAEDIDEGFTYYESVISSCFKIFNDDFCVPVHHDSFVLTIARSGHGKSTFANHIAAKAVLEKRKVFLYSNELNAYAYLYLVSLIVGQQTGDTDVRRVASRVVRYLTIFDETISLGVTSCWDAVADYIVGHATEGKPDLVIYDQLSNADKCLNPANQKLYPSPFQQLKFISSRIKHHINLRKKLPPILSFQQGYSPDMKRHPSAWDAQTVARNGKGMIEDATHVFILGRKDNATYIKCDKYRMPKIPYDLVSGFKYDASTGKFEKIDVPDDWGKKTDEKK